MPLGTPQPPLERLAAVDVRNGPWKSIIIHLPDTRKRVYNFPMPRRKPTKRYSIQLVHLYPWKHEKPRKSFLGVKFFKDKQTAFEEAVLLAVRQDGVAVVNDELDMETIAQFDAKDKRLVQLRNNPYFKRRR